MNRNLQPSNEQALRDTRMNRNLQPSNEQALRDTPGAVRWNGHADLGWVALQTLLDQVFRPIEDLLVRAPSSTPSCHVLDVGCGTGSTTVAIATRLGADAASCTGIDISQAMIAAARERAERDRVNVRFVVGDAQTYPFERGSFDTIISRFGVMFFNDSVDAMANLHRAATPDAKLRFVVWRSAAENPFMTTAERAAAPLLPQLPGRQPNEPGQFAFADADRVRGLLEKSGWSETEIRPVDVPCAMPESALLGYLTQLGPVGRILQQADDELCAQVIAAIRPAFGPYVCGTEVRFTAACWLITARA